jgi:hypothetical protein
VLAADDCCVAPEIVPPAQNRANVPYISRNSCFTLPDYVPHSGGTGLVDPKLASLLYIGSDKTGCKSHLLQFYHSEYAVYQKKEAYSSHDRRDRKNYPLSDEGFFGDRNAGNRLAKGQALGGRPRVCIGAWSVPMGPVNA